MASSAIKGLAFGAALFGGLQAGATANRAFVLLAAWERLGVIPWVNFTRAENVGVGALFYPVLGLAALLFTVSAAIAFRLDRTERGSRRFPVYAAALLAIVWATVTRALILPAMFVLRDASTDTAQLQQIFLTVSRWSGVNDVLHILTFALNLWALAVVFSGPNMN
ncbi:MAG: hypothetical protein AUI12_17150 [Acidobacteria bacterium 13_2_20CM_2_57_6]|nr:MAG: hypothetical protein AUH16_01110 [Acidobacteria bacterium 13_2_20CM_57_7]OLB83134.1 MAG: hypothetical protein AUI12_17150 [Acidobacteria bacterium 13_2_20CM_2_57_6]PYT40180.1 MAG: hypothetical protein DMG47_19880 [Acidobacteriota bacterium]PYT42707.1 MAG: hypothetical protein DMG45_08925 [Acidobacteriota bacterium]